MEDRNKLIRTHSYKIYLIFKNEKKCSGIPKHYASSIHITINAFLCSNLKQQANKDVQNNLIFFEAKSTNLYIIEFHSY